MHYSFHVEPSSKCTLECPLCDRTKFYEKFKFRKLHDINIDHLFNFLKPYNGSSITLCGNNGDPIYHKNFLKLVEMLKSINFKITTVTNGSYKKDGWWRQFKKMLTSEDIVKFSIDGLGDTNHLYRVNSDWGSIQLGINVMNTDKNCKTVWKFIVFKHNQHQIDEARKRAEDQNFDEFQLEKSDRWWDKEMMPDSDFVNSSYIHQHEAIRDTGIKIKTIKPKCILQSNPSKLLYIDSEGDFYPCCWMGLDAHKYKGIFSPKERKFNIKNNSLQDILKVSDVVKFFNSTKDYEKSDLCCKIYCGQNK